MKITKLIIPLLGLSQMSNANKQELLQLEKVKGLDVSYQVLAVESEPNYFDITAFDTNITENSIKNEVREPIACPGSAQLCESVLHYCIDRCCEFSFFPPGCYAGCLTAYGICMAACS